MASGADNMAPAADGEQSDNNIVNEQPIEISSDSDNEGCASQPNSDSESDVSVVSSSLTDESDDSQDEMRREEQFEAILAMPNKRYPKYIELCELAFQSDNFDKIEVAFTEFEKYCTIPSHIWLQYIRNLWLVTQTPAERSVYSAKCIRALSSQYNEHLASFIGNSLKEQPVMEQREMWAKILADYGLECTQLVNCVRDLLQEMDKKEDAAMIEKIFREKCVVWNCDEEQLKEIKHIIKEFKKTLNVSAKNSEWLQEMSILKADTLSIATNVKVTIAKFFYERSLVKYPTDGKLWKDYIEYMQKPVDPDSREETYTQIVDGYLSSKPMDLAARAVRAKPSICVNLKYLQLMEKEKYTLDRVNEVLNKIFDRIATNMVMTVELQLDYLAYRVRNTNVEDRQQVSDLRFEFRRVWDNLSDQYGDAADTTFEVLQLWAQVEYAKLKSPDMGANVWSEIMNYPGTSTRSHLWVAYAQMERQYNCASKSNNVLRQAALFLVSSSESRAVAEYYRRNERCFGTAETNFECHTYCRSSHRKYQLPEFRSSRRAAPRKYAPPARRQLPAAKKQMPVARKVLIKKSPPPATATEDEPKEPNFKYSTQLEKNKIFIKNLYARCTKEELTKEFEEFGTIKDVRLVHKTNNKFKGIAYIEYEKPEEAQKAVIVGDGMELGGLKIVVAISNPPPKPVAGTSTSGAAPKGEKRRIPTSLIPTTLVMQEVKRRKKLELDDDAAVSSTVDANGKSGNANGKESVADKEEAGEAATDEPEEPEPAEQRAPTPKSNDDFRKLFNN